MRAKVEEGKAKYIMKHGELRPGIPVGDIGLEADIGLPRPKRSVSTPGGGYRWEMKPRKR